MPLSAKNKLKTLLTSKVEPVNCLTKAFSPASPVNSLRNLFPNESSSMNALASLSARTSSSNYLERIKTMANTKRQVFYSFHFDNDVMRVQQIRNIGALEDNKPVSANEWEEIKKKGDDAIKKWINDNMVYRSCVVVLVGEKTASRPWVKYEIQKAWNDKKGLLGIYIHNIKCPKKTKETGTGTCSKGSNPFDEFNFTDGPNKGKKLSSVVKCHDPKSTDAYNDIKNNIEDWIEDAIKQRA